MIVPSAEQRLARRAGEHWWWVGGAFFHGRYNDPPMNNNFEEAFKELEGIVKRLESEELPLDESLRLFEQGIGLSRFCHQRLEEVEKKIELILADAKGQPRTEPFALADEEQDDIES
jgi:exodeoxyribonuclease VII small subunit